jgi:hypothetical protein
LFSRFQQLRDRHPVKSEFNFWHLLCSAFFYNGVTPLVVMAETYGQDLEGTDVNVSGNDWITYLEDGEQLRRLLPRLLPKVSNQDTIP